MFAKTGFEQCTVHIGDSDATERSWHILHTDRGPVAVALWYRRHEAGEVASIISLEPDFVFFCCFCYKPKNFEPLQHLLALDLT